MVIAATSRHCGETARPLFGAVNIWPDHDICVGVDVMPLCEGEWESRILPEGNEVVLEVRKTPSENGIARKPARFKIELGKLLQVGFGKAYEVTGPDGKISLRERKGTIEITYTTLRGLMMVCETLRRQFYQRLIDSLKHLKKR